jgi:hypothetical protein
LVSGDVEVACHDATAFKYSLRPAAEETGWDERDVYWDEERPGLARGQEAGFDSGGGAGVEAGFGDDFGEVG